MSDSVIKLENISKQYRLGTVGTNSMKADIESWWYRLRGKENKHLKIGQENTLSKGGGDYVWALKDINLEVKKGEILGVIGKNGAGKSTLLKLLSRVTVPSTGQIKINGRIASLLEVGTGFHGELTGRENIFLNGSILGMTKNEIHQQLDEIVEFAGIAKYIDTPVKRYSSGMYVRLGFAVAAHLNPDILIVDEVLAVGDAEFQKKAIGKMKEVSKGGERTVLFVSHNMASVSALCTKAVVLSEGSISYQGKVEDSIDYYLRREELVNGFALLKGKKSKLWKQKQNFSKLISIETLNVNNKQQSVFKMGDKLKIKLQIEITKLEKNIEIGVFIYGARDKIVGILLSSTEGFNKFKLGKQDFLIEMPCINLLPSEYTFGVLISNNEVIDDACEYAINFEVITNNFTKNFVDYNRFKGYNNVIRSNWIANN